MSASEVLLGRTAGRPEEKEDTCTVQTKVIQVRIAPVFLGDEGKDVKELRVNVQEKKIYLLNYQLDKIDQVIKFPKVAESSSSELLEAAEDDLELDALIKQFSLPEISPEDIKEIPYAERSDFISKLKGNVNTQLDLFCEDLSRPIPYKNKGKYVDFKVFVEKDFPKTINLIVSID